VFGTVTEPARPCVRSPGAIAPRPDRHRQGALSDGDSPRLLVTVRDESTSPKMALTAEREAQRRISRRPSVGSARPRSCLESHADAPGSRTLAGTASRSILGCCHPAEGPRSGSRRGPTRELCRARLLFVPGRSPTDSTSAAALRGGTRQILPLDQHKLSARRRTYSTKEPLPGQPRLRHTPLWSVHSTGTEYPCEPLRRPEPVLQPSLHSRPHRP
jgi:hypothetical protein